MVLKPVRTTIAVATPASFSMPRRTRTILVPLKTKCFANSGEIVVVRLNKWRTYNLERSTEIQLTWRDETVKTWVKMEESGLIRLGKDLVPHFLYRVTSTQAHSPPSTYSH